MGYEEISWTEASSEKSEVVGCVHEKSVILSGPSLGKAIKQKTGFNMISFIKHGIWRTEASSEKSEVVGCVHEKSMILSISH